MKKVFISAGHGGKDSGAIGNGFKEKDLTLKIAMACGNYLSNQGVAILMSRTKDEDDDLVQEANESNAYKPDLAVSVHINAGGGDGAEAWYSVTGGIGKTLAENILASITALTGQNSRGARTRVGSGGKDYYGFIRRTNAHAVIVECAFIDNAKDIEIINTDVKCTNMGVAIAKGILKTLGIDDTPVTITKPLPKPNLSNEELAREVLQGKWGNGEERKKRLTEAGYNYESVQRCVNELTKKNNTATKQMKSYEVIAKEVMKGVWGNGATRKKKLQQAGYNYTEVQKIVNRLSGKR